MSYEYPKTRSCFGAVLPRPHECQEYIASHELIALPYAKNRPTYDVIDLQDVPLYSETYRPRTGPSYDNQVRCDLIRGIADRTDNIAYFPDKYC